MGKSLETDIAYLASEKDGTRHVNREWCEWRAGCGERPLSVF